MEKKYTLRKSKTNRGLLRVVANKDFTLLDGSKVLKGDLGGLITSEENLSQEGNCWVCHDAKVIGEAKVLDDAVLFDSAIVNEHAVIKGKAMIKDKAIVTDDSTVVDSAVVSGSARIENNTCIMGNATVTGNALVMNSASISGHAVIKECAMISGGKISDSVVCSGHTQIYSKAIIKGKTVMTGRAAVIGKSFIKTNHTIGLNLFNDIEYSYNFSGEKYVKILDENYYEYSLVPVSSYGCLLVHPNNNVYVYLLRGFQNIPYGAAFEDFEDLWKTLRKEVVISERNQEKLSVSELLLYDFFVDLSYDNLASILGKASCYFIGCLLEGSIMPRKEKINDNMLYILKLYKKYMFAYIVGLFLRLYEKLEDIDNYENCDDAIAQLLNSCVMNFSDRSISSFGDGVLFNNELVEMVRNVCDFPASWSKDALSILSSSKNSFFLELLVD